MSDFKSALLRLGDDAFFELVRNYLGPIKTPFNKHDLIARLLAFLRREEIQDRIVSLIDDSDAETLSAIWLLGEPDFEEIHLFFAGQRSYLDLHQKVLNLEDRLLIYRAGDRLLLNPILRNLLEERVLSADRLFASRARRADDPQPSRPWVTDTLLVAVYGYAREKPEVFRADRSIRKRALADIENRLPALAERLPGQTSTPRATVLVDALAAAGALAEEPELRPVTRRWEELAELTPTGRIATLAAARATDGDSGFGVLAHAIEAVFTTLPRDRVMSAFSVERLLVVLAGERSAESCRRAREAMTLLGLLVPAGDESVFLAEPPIEHGEHKQLVVQPNFIVTMPEEFSFTNGLFVATISRLARHDRYPHFELTKERLASALREGVEIDDVLERLRRLAADTLPQNIAITMKTWAHEHESVRLFKGVILQVEEARRYAVEHSETVRELIHRQLAPGIYLVDEADVDALQRGLREAGVELVPELSTPHRHSPPRLALRNHELGLVPARLETFARFFSEDGASSSDETGREQADDSVRADASRTAGHSLWMNEVRSRLEDPALSSEQREELASRIKHKLILTSDQVQPGALKSEKTEARGLDYVGKVRIIEHAIRSGTSFIEVIERTGDGSPQRRLIEPIEMSKRGNELILIGDELPERTRVELHVRKLGLVRRLRSALVRRRAERQ
ncbi:MAG: hypothetical protein ACOC2Y_02705 [Spirochaetota bacterium]